jgi:phosphinothricin acetyltransferase
MTGPVEIREAQETDMPAFSVIVNYFIHTTTFNFRTLPQTPDEWRDDWKLVRDRYPWLVATVDNEPVGIAYAGPWKARNAYDWCAESTVYVANGKHRRGVGRRLYTELLGILDAQGYRTTVGVVGLPNPASVALHEACGFRHAGTLKAVGYKMGQWCDVGFWQRTAADGDAPPGDLLPVSAIMRANP